MITIIDMTKAFTHTAPAVLRAALDTENVRAGLIRVYAFEQQTPIVYDVLGDASNATVLPLPDGSSEYFVVSKIEADVSGLLADGETVRVMSFSRPLRHMVFDQAPRYAGRLTYVSLHARADAGRPQWDSAFMSEEEAAAAVARALAKRPTGTVDKAALRPVLEQDDPRFGKHSGGFASAPGFMSMLVELTKKRGLISTFGEGAHVTVALTEQGRASATSTGGDRDSRASDVSELVDPSATRSDQFLSVWKAAKLGPFMTVRSTVYDEIEKNVADHGTTLKALVSDAVTVVRESGIETSPTFPWSRVTQFIERLMRMRPVALSEGHPVSLTWTNGSTEITEMVEDWQLRLDGQLVLHLVDEGLEVRIDDMPDLAGALYAGRSEDKINRAYAVVRRLIEDQHLAEVAPDEPLRRPPATRLRAPDVAPSARDLRLASSPETNNA